MLTKSQLLHLLEISEGTESSAILKSICEKFGSNYQELIDNEIIVFREKLTEIEVRDDDELYCTEVIRRESKNMYLSQLNGWKEAKDDEIYVYQINYHAFVRQIMNALGVGEHIKPKIVLENGIWALGKQWINKIKVPIILVRSIKSESVRYSLSEYLKANHRSSDPALVLVMDRHMPINFSLPFGNVITKLEEALLIESDKFELNFNVLSGLMGGVSFKEGFSPDFLSLRFNGREYSFTTTESEAIKVMARAKRKLNQHTILEEIGSTQKRLRDIFKQKGTVNDAWGAVIQYDNKGMYWLNDEIPVNVDY